MLVLNPVQRLLDIPLGLAAHVPRRSPGRRHRPVGQLRLLDRQLVIPVQQPVGDLRVLDLPDGGVDRFIGRRDAVLRRPHRRGHLLGDGFLAALQLRRDVGLTEGRVRLLPHGGEVLDLLGAFDRAPFRPHFLQPGDGLRLVLIHDGMRVRLMDAVGNQRGFGLAGQKGVQNLVSFGLIRGIEIFPDEPLGRFRLVVLALDAAHRPEDAVQRELVGVAFGQHRQQVIELELQFRDVVQRALRQSVRQYPQATGIGVWFQYPERLEEVIGKRTARAVGKDRRPTVLPRPIERVRPQMLFDRLIDLLDKGIGLLHQGRVFGVDRLGHDLVERPVSAVDRGELMLPRFLGRENLVDFFRQPFPVLLRQPLCPILGLCQRPIGPAVTRTQAVPLALARRRLRILRRPDGLARAR